mmetsp:Transcript_3240/g.3514  ORF Transcript_3240/g.3514 Transcript_3240/m.3514 type:complete len:81 (-) Transcript_3240:1381-1623(-)
MLHWQEDNFEGMMDCFHTRKENNANGKDPKIERKDQEPEKKVKGGIYCSISIRTKVDLEPRSGEVGTLGNLTTTKFDRTL